MVWRICPLDKISCASVGRVPDAYNGIQVNYCKNPLCPNYGVPVSNENQSRGRFQDPLKKDGYVAGKKIDQDQVLVIRYKCKYCRAEFPAKSNLGIFEEAARYSSYLDTKQDLACPNEFCETFARPPSQAAP
jgi:hypothetical protein